MSLKFALISLKTNELIELNAQSTNPELSEFYEVQTEQDFSNLETNRYTYNLNEGRFYPIGTRAAKNSDVQSVKQTVFPDASSVQFAIEGLPSWVTIPEGAGLTVGVGDVAIPPVDVWFKCEQFRLYQGNEVLMLGESKKLQGDLFIVDRDKLLDPDPFPPGYPETERHVEKFAKNLNIYQGQQIIPGYVGKLPAGYWVLLRLKNLGKGSCEFTTNFILHKDLTVKS